MSDVSVPPLPQVTTWPADAQRDRLEFEFLELEAKLKRSEHRERSQRYMIKWVAVFAGVGVIVAMFWLLTHLFHHMVWGPFIVANPAMSVAMIVSPILSITAITVALFVGAFRKFEDGDLESMGNGAMGAASALRGGG
jgi:hypothetical protein